MTDTRAMSESAGMTDNSAALIWCPFPDRESARVVAGRLLGEKLIACANIVGDIESVFEWEGKRTSDHEVGVLFKTLGCQSDEVIRRLGVLHPYDTPAIVGWPCAMAHPATLAWLQEQLAGRKQ